MNIWKMILVALSLLFLAIGFGMSAIPSDQFVEMGSIIAVSAISLPAFYGLYKTHGRYGILAILALGIFALTIESIGIHTGFPYSHFEYTMPFGYQLFGTTPWTVFIAWSPLVIGSYLITQHVFKKAIPQFISYISLLVLTDMVLDPGAVARGLWSYSNGGIWFNVPVQNFFGWMFSGTIAYAIIRIILARKHHSNKVGLYYGSLSLLLSLFLWTGVAIGYSLWLPAVIGIIVGKILLLKLFDVNKKLSQV